MSARSKECRTQDGLEVLGQDQELTKGQHDQGLPDGQSSVVWSSIYH